MKKYFVVLFLSCFLPVLALGKTHKDVADEVIGKLPLGKETLTYVKTEELPQLQGYKAVVYEVARGVVLIPFPIYVSDDKKTALFGEIFLEGKSLSQEAGLQARLKKIDFDPVDLGRIIYNPQGRLTVFVFVDPDCPHCQTAMASIQAYSGKDYRFVIKHFPLTAIHPSAYDKAVRQQEQWIGKSFPALTPEDITKRATQIVEEDIQEGKRAGLDGTPYFIADRQFLPSSPIGPEATGNITLR